jgi:hypothetical protein
MATPFRTAKGKAKVEGGGDTGLAACSRKEAGQSCGQVAASDTF